MTSAPHTGDELERLAFDDADGFDIALRRRTTREHGAVFELVVNGMFAMDSLDASSEIALAALVDEDAREVLVGGLGLGFTAGALLDRLPHVRVVVAELSSGLVEWARRGLVPTLGRVADDERAELVHTDVARLLREPSSRGRFDAVLLDVDNGPDFLIHDHNAELYGDDLLTAAAGCLAPGGLLAIWCEGETPSLDESLRRLDGEVEAHFVDVEREGHAIRYAIHCLRAPAA